MPFEVPSSWEWMSVASFSYDLLYGTSEKSSNEGLVPVLRMGNITRLGSIDYSDLVYSSNEEDIKKYKLEKDDLLFNRTNSCEWVGKTAIFKLEKPTIYAGYLIRIRCILVSPDYINFVMNSSYHREWCNQVKTDAVNQSNINAQKLSNFLIPIPPLSEQQRIVAEIEKWVALIEQIEQEKVDLQTTIKQAKSKILDLAIHGKLVLQDPSDEPATELLKRINPKAEITCDNGQYGKLPEKWVWTTVKDISKSILYGVSESAKLEGKYKLLRITDIQNNQVDWKTVPFTDFDDNKVSSYILHDGDIVFARTGATVGKSYLIKGLSQKAIYASYLIRVRTFDLILPEYVKLFFESGYYWEQIELSSVGIGQPNVNGTILGNLNIPLPPLAEQHRIVAKIEELFTSLDNIQKALEV